MLGNVSIGVVGCGDNLARYVEDDAVVFSDMSEVDDMVGDPVKYPLVIDGNFEPEPEGERLNPVTTFVRAPAAGESAKAISRA